MTPQDRLATALSVALHDEEPRWSPTGVRLFSDAVVAADPDLAADIELGQEWRLTEAALPTKAITVRGPYRWGDGVATYAATIGYGHDQRRGTGPTPAAALRALREKLEQAK